MWREIAATMRNLKRHRATKVSARAIAEHNLKAIHFLIELDLFGSEVQLANGWKPQPPGRRPTLKKYGISLPGKNPTPQHKTPRASIKSWRRHILVAGFSAPIEETSDRWSTLDQTKPKLNRLPSMTSSYVFKCMWDPIHRRKTQCEVNKVTKWPFHIAQWESMNECEETRACDMHNPEGMRHQSVSCWRTITMSDASHTY